MTLNAKAEKKKASKQAVFQAAIFLEELLTL